MNVYERIGRVAALRYKVFGLLEELDTVTPHFVNVGGESAEAREPWVEANARFNQAAQDLDNVMEWLADTAEEMEEAADSPPQSPTDC